MGVFASVVYCSSDGPSLRIVCVLVTATGAYTNLNGSQVQGCDSELITRIQIDVLLDQKLRSHTHTHVHVHSGLLVVLHRGAVCECVLWRVLLSTYLHDV